MGLAVHVLARHRADAVGDAARQQVPAGLVFGISPGENLGYGAGIFAGRG